MIRHLTLASKAQQKEWLALFEDPEQHAPQAYQLKQWLFGGQSIPTKSALFPLAEYPGRIVADLFGEEGYFAEAELFWQKQNEAIAAKRDALLAAGWAEVVMLETGQGFSGWEHEKSADNHSDFRVLTQASKSAPAGCGRTRPPARST